MNVCCALLAAVYRTQSYRDSHRPIFISCHSTRGTAIKMLMTKSESKCATKISKNAADGEPCNVYGYTL